MPIDSSCLQYIGAYVSSDAAVVTSEPRDSIPGNLNWIEANSFPRYKGAASVDVILEFRTPCIEIVLSEFRQLEPVRRNADGHRTVVVEYDGVPVKLIEAKPALPRRDNDFVYHSFWIPRSEPHDQEIRLEDAKMYVSSSPNPFGIGWVRYDSDAPYSSVVRYLPHVALSVESVEDAVDGFDILFPPKQTQPGLRIAFVECGGFPVEFIEIDPQILPNGV